MENILTFCSWVDYNSVGGLETTKDNSIDDICNIFIE